MGSNQIYINPYIVLGDIVKLYDTRENEFLIDKEDFDSVIQHVWHVTNGNHVYAHFGDKVVGLHQFLLGDVDGVIDHINRDGLDNRRCNLRVCSQHQNTMNRKYKNPLGFRNVYTLKHAPGRYYSKITYNYKSIFLGGYDTPEEAYKAYVEAAHKYYGDYATEEVKADYEKYFGKGV